MKTSVLRWRRNRIANRGFRSSRVVKVINLLVIDSSRDPIDRKAHFS